MRWHFRRKRSYLLKRIYGVEVVQAVIRQCRDFNQRVRDDSGGFLVFQR
jgi:hypothetical protein